MRKKVLLFFVFMYSILGLNAQTYPVQLVPEVIAPHPIYLSDYSKGDLASDRMRLNVLLTDLTKNNLNVILKVSLQGQGIFAQSKQQVVGVQPIVLDGGVALQLGSAELAPYFKFENLRGISAQQYANVLPEGMYSFCFEVFETATGNRLSEKTCAKVILFQNNPPQLIQPSNSSTIAYQDNYNILFQWSPRHLNISHVKYKLSIAQLLNDFIDPQTVFSTPGLTIFEQEVNQTSLLYDLRFPALVPGYKYAWRVQAITEQGADQIGLFNNHGYSEIWSFTYDKPCRAPEFVTTEAVGRRHVKISWQDSGEHLDFGVSYRQKSANSNWYNKTTPNNELTINNLEPGTTYQYKVGGYCELGNVVYGSIYEFTTQEETQDISQYQGCNIEPDPADLSNKSLLMNLFAGDLIFAGDFPVTILQLDSNNSPFTGKGYISIPWLNFARVGVKFKSIQVNTDYKLVEGFIETTYDEDWDNISFIDPIEEPFEGDNDIVEVDLEIEIESVEVNDDGELIITGVNGEVIQYPIGDDYVITGINQDGSTQVYHVDQDGNVTQAGQVAQGGAIDSNQISGFSESGNLEQLSSQGIVVTFIESGSYGFDKIPDHLRSVMKSYYQTITDANGASYDIIHKAIVNGQEDELKAKIQTDDPALIDQLVFKTKQGIEIPHTISPNKKEAVLELKGVYSYENELVYATIVDADDDKKQTIAGAFRLWHITQKEVSVVVVPLNGVSIPNDLEQELNAIYKSAGVEFSLINDSNFEVPTSTWSGNSIDVGNSGWFSHYTEDQLAIMNYYTKQKESYSDQTYYLFVTDVLPSRPVSGFMPLKSQYGFIFNSVDNPEEEQKGNFYKTVAHELAHGVFGLRHPFDEYGTPKPNSLQDTNSTPWLLDYTSGVKFTHMDWKQMHNPDFELYPFQSDQEGENVTISDAFKDLDFGVNVGGDSFSFLTPAAETIVLPLNVENVKFYFGYYGNSEQGELDNFIHYIPGTLKSFKIDNLHYQAEVVKSNDASVPPKLLGYFAKIQQHSRLSGAKRDYIYTLLRRWSQ